MVESEGEQGRVREGGVYRFHKLMQVEESGGTVTRDVAGGLYRVVSVSCKHGQTGQDMILYVGQGPPDDGKYVVCTPLDFVVHFRPTWGGDSGKSDDRPPDPPPAEKSAGAYEGSGF